MPFDGNGVFQRVRNWVQDAANDIPILANRHDSEDDNFSNGLTNCLTKDGQSTPTNDIKMGGKRLINLGAGTSGTDAATVGQVQSGALSYFSDTGTANTYAISPTPAIASYSAGQAFRVKVANTNTGASTFAVGILPELPILTDSGDPIPADTILGNGIYTFVNNITSWQIEVFIRGVGVGAGLTLDDSAPLYPKLSIADSVITDAMLVDMPTKTIKGNDTEAAATPDNLTGTEVTAMLDTFTATLKGLVPPPTTSTGVKVLADDGTWIKPDNIGFISNSQAILISSSYTYTHGLGRVPFVVSIWIKCIATDLGYDVGDTVQINPTVQTVQEIARIVGISIDNSNTTTFTLHMGQVNTYSIPNKTTNALSYITANRWEIFCKAM